MPDDEGVPTADEVREDLLSHLGELDHFEDLVAVWLFGSRTREEHRPGSDVDVACFYDLDRAELANLSVQLAGRLPDRYDAEVFQLLPLPVRKEVLGGQLVWTRDKDRVYDLAYETLREHARFDPLYREVIA